jgi:hypothetical protein
MNEASPLLSVGSKSYKLREKRIFCVSVSDEEKKVVLRLVQVEAPVFRPTEKEFKDPMKYIDRIRREAEPFGICKIIPPRHQHYKTFYGRNL